MSLHLHSLLFIKFFTLNHMSLNSIRMLFTSCNLLYIQSLLTNTLLNSICYKSLTNIWFNHVHFILTSSASIINYLLFVCSHTWFWVHGNINKLIIHMIKTTVIVINLLLWVSNKVRENIVLVSKCVNQLDQIKLCHYSFMLVLVVSCWMWLLPIVTTFTYYLNILTICCYHSNWICSGSNYWLALLDVLHDHIMLYLCCIIWITLIFSLISVVCSLRSRFTYSIVGDGLYEPTVMIESMLILLPVIILATIGVTSVLLLFILDVVCVERSIDFSISVVAHQWYWSCAYTDFDVVTDMFMLPVITIKDYYDHLEFNHCLVLIRLTDTDNRLLLITNIAIRIMLSSEDVLHCWALLSILIKIDAIPGHVVVISTLGSVPGIIVGYCAELCGSNHRYMPIVVESTTYCNIVDWFTIVN